MGGLDDKGVLHVIDEVNTPDSSRLCTVEEWETKYPKIAAEMKSGQYKNVNEVLKARPDLKLKEFSKQYVRKDSEARGGGRAVVEEGASRLIDADSRFAATRSFGVRVVFFSLRVFSRL